VKESSNRIARDLIRLGDLDAATRFAEAEFQRPSGGQPLLEGFWGMCLIRADLLRLRGRTEEALAFLLSEEEAFPPNAGDLPTLIGLKKSRGYCLGQLGKYAQSHGLLQEAEYAAREAGLLELLCEVYQCQAMIFYLERDYESSDRFFRLILDASDLVGGWYFRGNALWGIGKNLMIQGHYRAAMPWLEESLALYESAGARLLIAIVWSEMAVCHLGLGDDQKSLELLENALRIQSEAGTVQNYLVVLANIGNVYSHRGDYLTAIAYFRRALELAREIKDPVSIQKWSGNLRLAYASLRQSVDRLDSRTA
jgi:tetratricopeptide (TPR) repeat protein